MIARSFVFLAAAALLAAQEDGAAFFEKNVRPLLARQCLGCHSATSQPIMGGLRLDDRDLALKGGGRGASLVPGKPAESLLLKAVRHDAGALKMPPGPKLKDADISVLTQWIGMGAPWGKAVVSSTPAEKFWAFVPPQKSSVPAVGARAWVKSPIDAFVLAGLEAKGLKPASPADKRTLIRRATFDLTGLPPTPEEVRAFLADNSPDAFSKVIDRLLASPRYGERWGRHWLDVARYADSNGLDENLVYKNAFRYRDYVVSAFNKDKPFDLFLKEQIAGDLVPDTGDLNTSFERWTATGFLSLGAKMLAEDDPVKMEMDIVDEQVDTTMRTFNALTVGCARCHDHKFDPIQQADYYRIASIFNGVYHGERYIATKEQREAYRAQAGPLEVSIASTKTKLELLSKAAAPALAEAEKRVRARHREPITPFLTEETFAPVEARHLRIVAPNGVPGGLDEIEVFTTAGKNAARDAVIETSTTRIADGNPDAYHRRHLNDGAFDKRWFPVPGSQATVTLQFASTVTINRAVWSTDRLKAFQGRFQQQG